VCDLSALSAVNHCPATQAIANAGKKSAKSFALMSRLAGFPSKTDTLRQNLDGQKGSLHVEPSSTSDKRDDVLPARYVLAGVPFVILRPGPLARLPPAGGWRCGVSQIVKTAQYRGRLSAPCLYGDFYSPQARPRGAQECCGKAYSFILMSLYSSLHPSHHADKQ
jgi:hypothetical protein